MVPLIINHPKGTTPLVPTNNEPVFSSAFRGTMFLLSSCEKASEWQMTLALLALAADFSVRRSIVSYNTVATGGKGMMRGEWWGVKGLSWCERWTGTLSIWNGKLPLENRLPWDRKFIDLYSFTELEGIIHKKGPIRKRANHHSRRLFFEGLG